MRPDETFSPLRIVKKNISDFDRSAYRVYKSSTEYVTVDAATALEAFRESGIAKPVRILRETRFMDRLVAQSRFSELEEIIETGVMMAPPPKVAGHQEPVPQTQPKQAQPQQAQSPQAEKPAQSEWTPTPPQPKAAAEPEPEPAPEAKAVAEDAPPSQEQAPQAGNDELSEDDIEQLLASPGDSVQSGSSATDGSGESDELSEEEIAKLLDNG
jgi:outer membrane biosynthesis protein TonB